jgi:catalase
MMGHLGLIDPQLQADVAEALGTSEADQIQPAVEPRELAPSDALSLIKKAVPTLKGRKIGVLVTDGFDEKLLENLRSRAKAEKASLALIAPRINGAVDSSGKLNKADHSLSGAPSIFFDTVAILASENGAIKLASEAAAVDWARDAFGHLKVLAHTPEAQVLLNKAAIEPDAGVVEITDSKSVSKFIKQAKAGRIWDRELKLRSPG